MKKVIIMRGIPGAGKGHYVDAVVEECSYPGQECQVTVASADHYFERNGRYDFDPTKLPEAHASCMTAFLQALQEEHELVIVDNTSIKLWMVEQYMKAARLADYDVEVVEVMPETLADLKKIVGRNSHGVPADVVAKMAIEFEPYRGASRILPGF
jgi:hypothetical protein